MHNIAKERLIALLLVMALLNSGCMIGGVQIGKSPIMCMRSQAGWAYPVNDYYYFYSNSRLKIAKRPQTVPNYKSCSAQHMRDRIIESEFSLSYKDTFLRVSGEVCSNNATLILHAYSSFLMPDQVRRRFQYAEKYGTSDKNLRQFAPYDFYVPWQGDLIKRGYLNGVERSLVIYKAILAKQCETIPNHVRVVGRGDFTRIKHDIRGRWDKNTPYVWKEFYSGWFNPRNAEVELRHDDSELAARYQSYAVIRQSTINQKNWSRARRQQEGAALFMMMLYGIYSSSPCNDPDVPADKKPYWCD